MNKNTQAENADYTPYSKKRINEALNTMNKNTQAEQIAIALHVEGSHNRKPMNKNTDKLKIKVEVIRRYYVEQEGWIYGGPFDSKEEAQLCIKQAKLFANKNQFIEA